MLDIDVRSARTETAGRCYVLVQLAPASPPEIMRMIRGLEGVERADLVTGPYDVVVVPTADRRARTLVAELTAIPQVHRALLCAPPDGCD